LDEAAQSPERAYDVFKPTLIAANGIIIATTTVLGMDWTYDRLEKPALVEHEPGYWATRYWTEENPLFRQNPQAMQKIERDRRQMSPEFFAQEYKAERRNAQGLVYNWQELERAYLPDDDAVRKHIPEWPNIDPSRKILIGLDSGADHPFGGIMIVVLTAPDSAIGGAPWAVAAFCVAPILWATGSLLTANVDRPVDRVAASAVQLLAGGTVLLLVALSLGELDPTRWSDVSSTSAGAAVFLLVFDSLVGFVLYTRLLESAPAPLVSTYAYVTPLVGAVIGATVLDESLWAGAFVGGVLVLGAVALELRG